MEAFFISLGCLIPFLNIAITKDSMNNNNKRWTVLSGWSYYGNYDVF